MFTGSLPDFRRIAVKMPENHGEKGFLIRLGLLCLLAVIGHGLENASLKKTDLHVLVLFMSCVILAIVLQNVLNSGTG